MRFSSLFFLTREEFFERSSRPSTTSVLSTMWWRGFRGPFSWTGSACDALVGLMPIQQPTRRSVNVTWSLSTPSSRSAFGAAYAEYSSAREFFGNSRRPIALNSRLYESKHSRHLLFELLILDPVCQSDGQTPRLFAEPAAPRFRHEQVLLWKDNMYVFAPTSLFKPRPVLSYNSLTRWRIHQPSIDTLVSIT